MNSGRETYVLLKTDREEGLKLIFELYSKKLLGYAQHQWKIDPDPAWDLIYKTMYKVADTIHEYEFENEQKFVAFIFKVFMNYLRNHVRDIKTAMQGNVEIELNDKVINNYTKPQEKTSLDPALIFLKEELEKLEDWQRILLLMRGQEMSYSEIAKYVDKPEEQLKVYYARLKKQIAEKINERLKNQNLKNV